MKLLAILLLFVPAAITAGVPARESGAHLRAQRPGDRPALGLSRSRDRRDFDAEVANEAHAASQGARWSRTRSVSVLVGSAAFIGWLSEILVGSTEEAINGVGLSEVFVGVIVVPIIGNAAEHSSAIFMAMRNRMDLAVSIAVGSSAQVALFLAPILVFVGLALRQPMDLAFNIFEAASVALAVAVASSVVRDAESHWLEGAFSCSSTPC